MKKKIIALLFATLLLTSSCGSTKPAADECCEKKVLVTQREADEKLLNGFLFALVTYAIFSMIK